jgi:hypothetical protein
MSARISSSRLSASTIEANGRRGRHELTPQLPWRVAVRTLIPGTRGIAARWASWRRSSTIERSPPRNCNVRVSWNASAPPLSRSRRARWSTRM